MDYYGIYNFSEEALAIFDKEEWRYNGLVNGKIFNHSIFVLLSALPALKYHSSFKIFDFLRSLISLLYYSV
ncbi:hypothetical protein [Gottschalkia acidurici]|uniref:hypothetical protein n=1 Tax=Clostridium acidurici TaxID=1556 RepID=UPI0005A0007C|nr:hypothetical protein [Gottschalkia acidurici]